MFKSILGQLIYVLCYPFIVMAVHGSRRAYVVVLYGNKILVTKNWLDLNRKWRLPGGGAKPNENYKQAALRELREEVGIKLTNKDLTVLAGPQKHHNNFYYQIFLVKITAKPLLIPQQPEIWQAKFITTDQLLNQHKDEQLSLALSKLDKKNNFDKI